MTKPQKAHTRNTVFIIDPPADGKYFLILQRSMSPMMHNSSVFGVDNLDVLADGSGKPIAWVGTKADQTVVQFPIDSNYVLVERGSVRSISPVEAAKENYSEERALKRVYERILGKDKKAEEVTGLGTGLPGQYV